MAWNESNNTRFCKGDFSVLKSVTGKKSVTVKCFFPYLYIVSNGYVSGVYSRHKMSMLNILREKKSHKPKTSKTQFYNL